MLQEACLRLWLVEGLWPSYVTTVPSRSCVVLLCYNPGQAIPATAFSNFSQLFQILNWSVAVPSAKVFLEIFLTKKNSLPSDFCRLKWCSFLVWATQLDGQFFALNTLGSAFNWPEIWLVLSTWLYCPLCRFFNVIYLVFVNVVRNFCPWISKIS